MTDPSSSDSTQKLVEGLIRDQAVDDSSDLLHTRHAVSFEKDDCLSEHKTLKRTYQFFGVISGY